MRSSAGILLFRRRPAAAVEVLLGHMGGPFWAGRDDGAWTIPKGEYLPDEDPLAAASREFAEETGLTLEVDDLDERAIDLGEVRQSSSKRLRCWALEGDLDVSTVVSNTFEMEWPPRSGRTEEFPELDRAAWFPIELARGKVVRGQVALFDRLEAALGVSPATRSDPRRS